MRYHYDNSAANPRNPNRPPKMVVGGDQATDEMAHLWLQILPRGAGEKRPMIEEALLRHRIEKYPNDYDARVRLGILLLARLDPAGAASTLELATRIAPRRPEAHNLYGAALSALGLPRDAMEEFRIALQIDPDNGQAHYNLARALAKWGQTEEAEKEYRRAIELLPENAQLRNDYGELLLRLGKASDALEQFEKALALDPANKSAQENREQARKLLAQH